jgi:hypothetical protein
VLRLCSLSIERAYSPSSTTRSHRSRANYASLMVLLVLTVGANVARAQESVLPPASVEAPSAERTMRVARSRFVFGAPMSFASPNGNSLFMAAPFAELNVRVADEVDFAVRVASGLFLGNYGAGGGALIRPMNPSVSVYWANDSFRLDRYAMRLRVGGTITAPLTRAITDNVHDLTIYDMSARLALRSRAWEYADDTFAVGLVADWLAEIDQLRLTVGLATILGVFVPNGGNAAAGAYLQLDTTAECVIDDTSLGGGFVLAYVSYLGGDAQFSPFIQAQFGQDEVFGRLRAGLGVVAKPVLTSGSSSSSTDITWSLTWEIGVRL